MEYDTQNDSDEDENSEPLSYRLKLHAANPRYITSSEDCNRGDVILTVGQVRELIAMKDTSEEEIATIWLTTAEMGFSLTEEQDEVVCAKDMKEGKISDRFLGAHTVACIEREHILSGSLWPPSQVHTQ
jgi:hypothetical protein